MADDYASSTSTTGTFAVGQPVTGNIEEAEDSDWFAVTLTAGVTYQFYLHGSQLNAGTFPGGTLADPFLTLRDSAGVIITTNDTGLGNNPVINFTPQTSGVFYLDARAAIPAATGTYTLSVVPFVPASQIADYMINGFWSYQASVPRRWEGGAFTVNITDLSPSEQALATRALELFADVAGISFSFTTGAANLTYINDGTGFAQATGIPDANGFMTSMTVHISSDRGEAASFNSRGFQIYLHETAHALGLGHSGPYAGDHSLSTDRLFANDNLQWTVGTYFGWPGQDLHNRILTPQMADIYAVQQLYGANTSTRTGDTAYGFNGTAGPLFDFATYGSQVSFTIYDSGGSDTFDCSGFAAPQTINLGSGTFSSVGGYEGNIGIYLTTTIENAIGGMGADTMVGNGADNSLDGRAGNDWIVGLDGDDVLAGGSGTNVLLGGAGTDLASYAGSASGVWVDLAAGVYSAAGVWDVFHDSIEGLAGGAHADTLFGDSGANLLRGSGGGDTLVGRGGNDTLLGEAGDDWMVGDGGDDVLEGGEGINVLQGGDGTDLASYASATSALWVDMNAGVYSAVGVWDVFFEAIEGVLGGSGNDSIFGNGSANTLRGGAGADALLGNAGDDRLEGGLGQDWIVGGDGNDRLIGGVNDVDVLTGGSGADTFDLGTNAGWDVAFDFNTGEDRFSLGGQQWLGFVTYDADGDGQEDDTLLGYAGGNFVALNVSGLTLAQWNALVDAPAGAASGEMIVADKDVEPLAGEGGLPDRSGVLRDGLHAEAVRGLAPELPRLLPDGPDGWGLVG